MADVGGLRLQSGCLECKVRTGIGDADEAFYLLDLAWGVVVGLRAHYRRSL